MRNRELCLQVAGLTLRVATSASDGPKLCLTGASRRFEAPANEAPDLELTALWGDLDRAVSGSLLFDSGGTWQLHRDGPADVFRFSAGSDGTAAYLECRLDASRTTGTLTVDRGFFGPDEAVPVLQYPLDEVLMVHLLGQGRGVELHACGVVTPEGKGLLFCGHSGAGKTTTARLWEELDGAVILSDDRIVVREMDGRFVMYGTPWHGEAELATSRSAPVDASFILEHGATNNLSHMSVADAAAQLAARAFVPFHDVRALEWSLGCLGRFADSVPCQRFAFVPDQSARDLVRASQRTESRSSEQKLPRPSGLASFAVDGIGS